MNTKKTEETETTVPENIFARLALARLAFHEQKIKKSGHNKFADYTYFQLEDFVVPGMKSLAAYNLMPIVSFSADVATMTVYSTTDDTAIVITSPMATASLKGCHEIQNLGAVETYQRRYLWMMLLEIVDDDALEEKQAVQAKPLATPEQLAAMHDYAAAGLMTDGQKTWLEKAGDKITEDQAAYVLEKLKAKESEQ